MRHDRLPEPEPPATIGTVGFRFADIADQSAIRSTSRAFRAYLDGVGLCAGDADLAEFLLVEALNNVAEHAYMGLPAGPFWVRANAGSMEVLAEIEDCGHALPAKRLPDADSPKTDGPLASSPEGGFGWALLNRHCHVLRYQRHSGRNHLFLGLPVNGFGLV